MSRVYLTCHRCSDGGCPADARLGIERLLTTEARRLVCLAGVQRSFSNAVTLLEQFCGWHVSDETIRQVCHAESDNVVEWRQDVPPEFGDLSDSDLSVEFQTDATKVNTTMGWKDLKIGVFCQRPRGESSTLDDWKQRSLPAPTARVAFGAIEEIEKFQVRWHDWSDRLGLKTFDHLNVIADGAEWIWNAAANQFPGHRGVLDIFHASEHIATTADALFGEGTDASRTWFETTRLALLGDGWYGVQKQIGHTLSEPVTEVGRTAIESLARYLASHSTRLNYRVRLSRGETIGSGLIEGACKQMIGRRMKQTGARWTIPNANRMAELASLTYSNQWNAYWLAA